MEGHLLHVNVDLRGRRVGQEILEDVVLPVGVQDAVRELAVKEVEGLCEVVLNRVAVPAVVEPAELAQEILRLRVVRLVFEVVIVNGLQPR